MNNACPLLFIFIVLFTHLFVFRDQWDSPQSVGGIRAILTEMNDQVSFSELIPVMMLSKFVEVFFSRSMCLLNRNTKIYSF